MDDRLEKQISFLLEIDKLKKILRRSYITDGSRHENDAEHSWHLAVMCFILAEYASQPLDLLRVIQMVLVHDLVEIYAGDVCVYDTDRREVQSQIERDAADRLFGMLPDDQALKLRAVWEEFEAGATPEARFARALDRLEPILLNYHTGGKAWKENKATAKLVMDLNLPIMYAGAPTIAGYVENLLLEAENRGYFYLPDDEPK
jgi:putative hydrolase of HD superfamily